VYSPAVIRVLTRPLAGLGLDHVPRLRATRQRAGDIAAAWRALPLAARAEDWSVSTAVADPPPLQVTREGRTCYLAHFNPLGAVYSPHPPPVGADYSSVLVRVVGEILGRRNAQTRVPRSLRILGDWHLRKALAEFARHYNEHRPFPLGWMRFSASTTHTTPYAKPCSLRRAAEGDSSFS
jgi:hypothetical protein